MFNYVQLFFYFLEIEIYCGFILQYVTCNC